MTGIYFSGTGNTKHCVETLTRSLDAEAALVALESADAAAAIAAETELIVFGYPIQFSNAPKLVRDFIAANAAAWRGKRVLCLATMGLFSGDGAGCAARPLKKCDARVVGGLHIKMPDSVCDVKALKRPFEENVRIVDAADAKLAAAAERIKRGAYPREGLGFFYHVAGLFGQRLWFRGKTKNYTDKLKVSDACVACGKCAELCPTGNLRLVGGRAVPADKCTMCYRCIANCPRQAITLLGKEVIEQSRFEKYESRK